MKAFFALAVMLACFLVLSGVGNQYVAAKEIPIPPFKVTFEPILPLNKNAPVLVDFSFAANIHYAHNMADTGSLTLVLVRELDRTDTLSKTYWPVKFDENYSYSTTLKFSLPDNDITRVVLLMVCGRLEFPDVRHFRTTDDDVEYIKGYMPPKPPVYREPDRDTLTHEQLQAEADVVMDLHSAEKKRIAEQILGSIPDSCLYNAERGYYRLTVTLGDLYKLADHRIRFDCITPPPWSRTYFDQKYRTPRRNSTPDKKPDSTENGPQGAVFDLHPPSWYDGIMLDSINGTLTAGILPTGKKSTSLL